MGGARSQEPSEGFGFSRAAATMASLDPEYLPTRFSGSTWASILGNVHVAGVPGPDLPLPDADRGAARPFSTRRAAVGVEVRVTAYAGEIEVSRLR